MCLNFCKIAVCSSDFTKMAPKMRVQTFFDVIFFVFFRGSLGKYEQNLFAPPKIYLLLHLCCILLLRKEVTSITPYSKTLLFSIKIPS